MSKKPPTGRLARMARLGGLTSRVGSSYLAERVKGAFQDEDRRTRALKKLHIENAEKVVQTMSQMKGAAMKVGQTLGAMVEGMDLPPEVARTLGQLNDKAEPVPWSIIRADVQASLDVDLDSCFDRFDPQPLGTASLGQAHAARLKDGTPVVVKVLHRGIDGSVESDLAALRSMFITGKLLRRDKAEIEAVFAEVQARLLEELDYVSEAANLAYFQRAVGDQRGLRVPRTYPELCTERVLTMDHLPGLPIDTFLAIATDDAKQRAGRVLARNFHHMVYVLRTLHADPHCGNFLFEPSGRVGLLDFGCVKRFDEHWVARYANAGMAAVEGRRADTLEVLRDLDCLRSRRPEAEDAIWRLCDVMTTPFRTDRYTAGGPTDTVQDQANRLLPRILRYPEIQAAPNVVYLNRALTGIYAVLRRLGLEADYRELFYLHARHAVAVAEGRTPDGSHGAPPLLPLD